MLRKRVSFLDELRAYVRDPQPIQPPDPAMVELARRHVFSRLGELEEERLPHEHRRWVDDVRLTRFVAAAIRELDRGIRPPPGRHAQLLLAAIDVGMVLGPGSLEPLEEREVVRIGVEAFGARFDVPDYATEVGLVRDSGRTRAGELFLALVGRDAVEWLLHLEVLRSTGFLDQWRTHPELAACYLHSEGPFEGLVPSSVPTRLEKLGILRIDGELLPLGRSILTNVLADPPTPMHLLAQAALTDDLSSLTGMRTTAASGSALESTALFAHEVRNALGPVRAAVDQIVRGDPPKPELLDRIQRGFDRLDRLASEASRLSQQLGAPEVVAVAEAVEEALAATQHERNGRLRVERHLVDAEAIGRRQRLVSALVNLIRNAAQAAPASGALLRVSLQVEAAVVRLILADNGPGVPESSIPSLFQPGFSLRGGSGLGLAHVQTVIADMGGAVRFRPSEGGGATFEITLRRGGGDP